MFALVNENKSIMKSKVLFSTLFLFYVSLFDSYGLETIKNVKLTEAGTISTFITEEEKSQIGILTISGPLNGDDIRFIREMAGWKYGNNINNSAEGNLRSLNMKDAFIVSGGSPFLQYGETTDGYKYPNDCGGIGQWVMEDIYTKTDTLDYLFFGLSQLEELVLPESTKDLGRNFMYGCYNIKSITIPPCVEDVMVGTFGLFSCLSLDSIFVSPNNPYLCSRDGVLIYPLRGGRSYGNGEDYPDGAMVLGAIPCARKEYSIPEDIDLTDWYSFPEGCQLKELNLLSKSPKLDPYYFDKLCLLENFNVDESNDRYASIDGVLYSKDISTLICYPHGRKDGTYIIPHSITTIGPACFSTSCYIESVVVPEGVKTLEGSSFFNCMKMKEITLPSTLDSIGSSSFQHCNNLNSITCKSMTPPKISDGYVFLMYELTNTVLYVPSESLDAYKNADYWKEFGERILPLKLSSIEMTSPNSATCSRDGNKIVVTGANDINKIELYSISGAYLGSEQVVNGEASFETDENLVIVKIGDKSIKVKK